MMGLRINVTTIFIVMLLLVVLISSPTAYAEEMSADDAVMQPCESKCGCQEYYVYDAVNDRCLVDFRKALKKVTVHYERNNINVLADGEMARSIYIEGEKIFKGIIVSVIIFMVCASVCIVTACIYCCRINYTDRKLKHNVKAVAKRLKKNYNSKDMVAKRAPLPVASENCSVVVEPGVFVA